MDILFIHNNFPGQFKNSAPALAKEGHRVWAISRKRFESDTWNGVKLHTYPTQDYSVTKQYPWMGMFLSHTILGECCYRMATKMKAQGFSPKLIIAHPGWGESLFMKDVWPDAKLGIYCEHYYSATGTETYFDPEFFQGSKNKQVFLRMRNVNNDMHLNLADAGISPTVWQKSSFPEPFSSKILVNHDGIETDLLVPNKHAFLSVRDHKINKGDELITFINRNLEPARGFHIFMRILPELLKKRPKARVIIIGGNEASYCSSPSNGSTWRQIFTDEVRPQISNDDWRRVHFVGKVPYSQFVAIMQISTVHVYLTYPFVLSWSLLEAMSMECAIVASDVEPLREVIEHGKTGLLVDYFDKEKLLQTICKLLDDPEKRKELGKNARNFVVKNYDLKTICLPKTLEWMHTLASS